VFKQNLDTALDAAIETPHPLTPSPRYGARENRDLSGTGSFF